MSQLNITEKINREIDTNLNVSILFFAVNSSYSHTMLSYGYIRSAVEKKNKNYKWAFKEYTLKDDIDSVCADIIKYKPDIVLSTLYLFNREFVTEVLGTVSIILPEIAVFLGGPEFLGDNWSFLREYKFVDAVIRGDESSLYRLLESYKKPMLWQEIPGVCVISDGVYLDNGTACFKDEDIGSLISPYYDELLITKKPFMQLETTRGCRGKCSFCTSAVSKYREIMTLSDVRQALTILRKACQKEIRVVDRTFNDNGQRAVDMLSLFVNEFSDMHFHLEINPAILSDNLVEVIKNFPVGMLHIEVGIQTLDKNVSSEVRRYGVVERTLNGLKILCSLTNIEIHADLIAGLPDQTIESVFQDTRIIIEIMPSELQLEILKILNGTPISEQVDKAGFFFLNHPPYGVIKTPSMSYFDILTIKRLSKIIDGYYNVSVLKSLFRFLCLKYSLFLEDFTKFYSERNKINAKLHLSARFKFLKEFIAEYNDKKVEDLLQFSWLAAGMQISEYGIKSISGHPSDGLEVIWQKEEPVFSKRYFEVSFAWNVGDIWLNSNSKIVNERTTYIFKLAYGNHPASISKVPAT